MTEGLTVIVIHTEDYAGNFERKLGAYVTGVSLPGDFGSEIAAQASSEMRHSSWWLDHLVAIERDGERAKLFHIVPTAGWFNNGWGDHYRDDPANYDAARLDARRAATEYQAPRAAKLRQQIAEDDLSGAECSTRQACEAELARMAVQLEAAGSVRHPAYLSVAFHSDVEPPAEVWQELMERAAFFAANPMKIAGPHFSERLTLTGMSISSTEPKREFTSDTGGPRI